MMRVLRPNGRLAVAVWSSLESAPGYARLATLLQRFFGDDAANALRAPFRMGDRQSLASLFARAEIPDAKIAEYEGSACFPSIRAWFFTEIKGWVLAGTLDDAQYENLFREGEKELKPFEGGGGAVKFPVRAHIATATKGA
jgi:hypothetical protein